MFVPDPVISLSIKPTGTETPNFSKALNRFQKEDPTFRVHVDSESQEVRSSLVRVSAQTEKILFPSLDYYLRHGRIAS
jgi:hypothetical protein